MKREELEETFMKTIPFLTERDIEKRHIIDMVCGLFVCFQFVLSELVRISSY